MENPKGNNDKNWHWTLEEFTEIRHSRALGERGEEYKRKIERMKKLVEGELFFEVDKNKLAEEYGSVKYLGLFTERGGSGQNHWEKCAKVADSMRYLKEFCLNPANLDMARVKDTNTGQMVSLAKMINNARKCGEAYENGIVSREQHNERLFELGKVFENLPEAMRAMFALYCRCPVKTDDAVWQFEVNGINQNYVSLMVRSLDFEEIFNSDSDTAPQWEIECSFVENGEWLIKSADDLCELMGYIESEMEERVDTEEAETHTKVIGAVYSENAGYRGEKASEETIITPGEKVDLDEWRQKYI